VGLAVVCLTACAASQAKNPAALQPATDRILQAGDIQLAQMHLREFGFDPGPVNGIFTAQTQAAVRAYQARYGLPVTGLLDQVTRYDLLPGLDQRETM
jgi:peptidoglycan hydrolase-like protein with peptidoglycan-binding domain